MLLLRIVFILLVATQAFAGFTCNKGQGKLSVAVLNATTSLDSLNDKYNQFAFGKKKISDVLITGGSERVGLSKYLTAFRVRNLRKYLEDLPNTQKKLGLIEARKIAAKLEQLTFFMQDPETIKGMSAAEKAFFREARVAIINDGLKAFLDLKTLSSTPADGKIANVWGKFKQNIPNTLGGKLVKLIETVIAPRINDSALPIDVATFVAHHGVKDSAKLLSDYQLKLYGKNLSNLAFRGWSIYLLYALVVSPSADLASASYVFAQTYPEEEKKVVAELKDTKAQIEVYTDKNAVLDELSRGIYEDSVAALEKGKGRPATEGEKKRILNMIMKREKQVVQISEEQPVDIPPPLEVEEEIEVPPPLEMEE